MTSETDPPVIPPTDQQPWPPPLDQLPSELVSPDEPRPPFEFKLVKGSTPTVVQVWDEVAKVLRETRDRLNEGMFDGVDMVSLPSLVAMLFCHYADHPPETEWIRGTFVYAFRKKRRGNPRSPFGRR